MQVGVYRHQRWSAIPRQYQPGLGPHSMCMWSRIGRKRSRSLRRRSSLDRVKFSFAGSAASCALVASLAGYDALATATFVVAGRTCKWHNSGMFGDASCRQRMN